MQQKISRRIKCDIIPMITNFSWIYDLLGLDFDGRKKKKEKRTICVPRTDLYPFDARNVPGIKSKHFPQGMKVYVRRQ